MSDVNQWSRTDANNNAVPPDGFPEGMPAGSVNDSARAVMGGVRRQWDEHGWFNFDRGNAAFVSATQFRITGATYAAQYVPGRRVRAVQAATITGSIVQVAVTANVDVTAVWNGGASLVSGALEIELGPDPLALQGAVTGTINMWSGATAPAGALLCDGAEHDRTTYAALYAIVGDTYGAGNGTTTFNVPDLRSRMPIGAGSGPGLTARARGDTGGSESHVLTEGNMPGTMFMDPVTSAQFGAGTFGAAITGFQRNGVSTPIDLMDPFLGVNFIIWT